MKNISRPTQHNLVKLINLKNCEHRVSEKLNLKLLNFFRSRLRANPEMC